MKEIKAQDWNTFCQRLSELERGASVDILWIDRASNTERPIARAAEFQQMSFGAKDGCNDQITIRAGGETETHHEIVEPINIRLRQSGKDGSYNGMAIEAEEGTTLVTFQPAIHSAALAGL
ncbi:MAG TPA: DUF5335 family protein [Verrucomicrobiae bacterium]|nr:DUF5335 family protein [Verrucomicrobiae bacterium]